MGKWKMPPSSNHQYWSRILKSKNSSKMVARPMKTNDMREWEKYMTDWCIEHFDQIEKGRKFCANVIRQGFQIRWDTYLCWNKGFLWCLDGSVKRNDLHDRLKAQHDFLSTQLGFDDRQIFASYEEKIEIENIKQPFFFIVLSPHKQRKLSEYKFGEISA